MVEFVELSDRGRRYSGQLRVRLGDADASGVIRLDGVAGVLQDIATDDWEDTGQAMWAILHEAREADEAEAREKELALADAKRPMNWLRRRFRRS